jgi:hypothetical protein
MAKTYKIPIRIALAFGVAAVADGLQFGVSWLTDHLLLPGEIADFTLDLIVAGILSLLIGFHPIFLPSFILKAVQIPYVEELPTWTACVAYLVWSQKREAGNNPQAASEPEAPQPAKEKPTLATLSVSTAPVTSQAGRSGLWYLVAGVCLVAGLIWFKHKTFAQTEPLPAFDETTARGFAQPIPATRNANPLVVVGPIENESSASSSARWQQRQSGMGNPEKIRTVIEDMLTGINGVRLLERQQAQVFLAQWKKDDGMTDAQRTAKLQMTTLPNLIVLVAITDIHEEKLNFKGYNITAKNDETHCSLRLQVMDTSDGSITFSRTLSGVKALQSTGALEASSTEDESFEAIKIALQKLDGDADFQDAVRSIQHEQVEVEFAPKPDNCDIEIDGHYVGGSPLTQKLLSGHEIKVRISKTGFKDWLGKLSPQAGLRVTRELEPTRTP